MTTASAWETTEQAGEASIYEEIIATHTLHIAPKHLGNLGAGVKETLHSMLLQWNQGLRAVPIVYTKADWTSGDSAPILFDNPCVHVNVRVRWLTLTPKAGARATGTVSNQGPEHLGLLLLGHFNVTIQASQLRSEYDWDEQEQSWINKKTCSILSIGDSVQFEIIGSSNDASVLVIFGSIDKMNIKASKEKSSKKSEKIAGPKGWSISATTTEEEKPKKDKKRKHDGKEKKTKKQKA